VAVLVMVITTVLLMKFLRGLWARLRGSVVAGRNSPA
jgi:hypothetical protein